MRSGAKKVGPCDGRNSGCPVERSLAARLISDQPGRSVTTTENDDAKLPLYAMLLISIDYGRSPLSIYVFPILLQQKLIELLRSPIYHIKSGRRSNLAVGCHIKKIAIATGITLRAVGRHIKPEFLEILNWTASWPIGDLVSPR